VDQSHEAAINRVLAILRQTCSRISAAMPLDRVTASAIRSHPSSPILEEAISAIYAVNQTLEDILEQAASRESMIGATPLAAFYEKEFRPNRKRLTDTFFDLLFEETHTGPQIEGDKRYRPVEAETTAYETLTTALADHETTLELNGRFDETDTRFDLKACRRLFTLPFFEPDLWLARQREIGPLLLGRRARNVPSHVRGRVKEIHHSFVLGNFLSAVALARSTLEYALIDRGRSLGYEPFETRMGNHSVKRLADLIDSASVVMPSLRDSMVRVREIGNQVLHPKKHYDVIRLSHVLEAQAFDCISALRRILVDLYNE
jgi:hypothetical protein